MRIGPVIINKDGGGIALAYTKTLKIAATVLYEGEPYEGPNMDKRERSIFLGGIFKWHDAIIQYYQDVENKSKGSVLTLTYAPEFNFGKFMISPRPYYQLWNDSYVDYYFGVKSTEIDLTRNRLNYKGNATTNFGFNVRAVYTEGPWQYFINIGQKHYGHEIKISPTVKRGNTGRFVLGFMYKFL